MIESPMNRVLKCPDMLERVFQLLRPWSRSPAPVPWEGANEWGPVGYEELQCTLARCARTCRAFSDPALDTLWEVMDDLVPLLRLLGRFEGNPVMLIGSINANTVSPHFDKYARRVKELWNFDPEKFDCSLWPFVAHYLAGEPLLPLIRNVKPLNFGLRNALGALLLLSPSLRVIDLILDFEEVTTHTPTRRFLQATSNFLGTIREVSPHVERIQISQCDFDGDSVDNVLSILSRFPRLKNLDLPVHVKFVPPTIRRLTTFPHLTSLTLRLETFNVVDWHGLDFGLGTFSELEELHIPNSFSGIDGTAAIVKAFRSRRLHTLSLRHYRDMGPSYASWNQSVDAICSHLREHHCPLRVLYLHGWVDCAHQREQLEFSVTTRSLMTFCMLESITLRIGFKMRVSDSDILAVVDAWPGRLRTFILTYDLPDDLPKDEADKYRDVRPTVLSLIYFATRTPALVSLTLSNVYIDPQTDMKDVPVARHPLRDLTLGKLTTVQGSLQGSDGYEVKAAALIDRLFPNVNLSDVELCGGMYVPGPAECDREWTKVQQILLAIQNGRRLW